MKNGWSVTVIECCEHAIAHIGIEKISRLASAELELANTFNSFTEYSQRYQRPQRGQIYTPVELEGNPEASKLFHQLNVVHVQ